MMAGKLTSGRGQYKNIAKQAKTVSACAGLQHNIIIILVSCHT